MKGRNVKTKPGSKPPAPHAAEQAYDQLIQRATRFCRRHLPRGAVTAVIAKGCPKLRAAAGPGARHFPVAVTGEPLGYHPANGRAAIAQIEAARAQGAGYLFLPEPSLWWLKSYPEFRLHLEQHYRLLAHAGDTGSLFSLTERPTAKTSCRGRLLDILAEFQARNDRDPVILDWQSGADAARLFPELTVFSPPTGTRQLPYLDATADIVLLNVRDRGFEREARRVAQSAVVTVGKTSASATVRWLPGAPSAAGASVSVVMICPASAHVRSPAHSLRSLQEALPPGFNGEVIFVSAGHAPRAAREVQSAAKKDARVKVVRTKSARDVAAACRQGAAEASGEFLVFLDARLALLPGWLSPLVGVFRDVPDAGVAAGLLFSADGTIAEAGREVFRDGRIACIGHGDTDHHLPHYDFVRPVDACGAGLFAMRRATWEKAGGLESGYVSADMAVTDFCFKVRALGLRTLLQPEAAAVRPHHGATADARDTRKLAARWRKALRAETAPPKRALVISRFPPEFDRDSGSRRMAELLDILRGDGWSITYVAATHLSSARYVRALQRRGIAVYDGKATDFAALLETHRFDLALVAFWKVAEMYLPRIRECSPRTRVLVDSVDLHYVRTARRAFGAEGGSRVPGQLDGVYGAEAVRELNVYAAVDGVLTVSPKEADLLQELIPQQGLARAVPDVEDLPPSPVPRAARRGIVFIGSFRHKPNVDAVTFLCEKIVPRLDRKLLARHPVQIVGDGLDDSIRALAAGCPHVRMIGWVPDVKPYLEHARISVVPLRYGAGTKRKLLQSLMVGTPTVSTQVGTEGFPVLAGKDVLVADDPARFATAIARLLKDDTAWERLARGGREAVLSVHGSDAAGQAFLQATNAVLRRRPKLGSPADVSGAATPAPVAAPAKPGAPIRWTPDEYERLKVRFRAFVEAHVPAGEKVLVASHGDGELLKFAGRTGRHYPAEPNGVYAGRHPANSEEALAWLAASQARGGRFLAFPATMLWWCNSYKKFGDHLKKRARLVASQADSGSLYEMLAPPAAPPPPKPAPPPTPIPAPTPPAPWTPARIEARRPVITRDWTLPARRERPAVLVLGIYLAKQPNAAPDVASVLAKTKHFRVTQKWIGLGGKSSDPRLARLTTRVVRRTTPKFELLNQMLKREDLSQYEFVVSVDDDIVLPHGFLDAYLALQWELGFGLAQPARTPDSFIDHWITEQNPGTIARQSLFVEIGPVFSVHRSSYAELLPFDLTSPMGWGYSNVWARLSQTKGLKLGIIDDTPVDHGLRAPLTYYDRGTAERDRAALLEKYQAPPVTQCYRVLDVIVPARRDLVHQPTRKPSPEAKITAVVPTHNRAALLGEALASLVNQSAGQDAYEVLVIDDGSNDRTPAVCREMAARLPLRYYRIRHSGLAVAKNLSIHLASAPILLFLDDDDVADRDLLRQHILTHEVFPGENWAVLGHTTWSPRLRVNTVMEYATEVGQTLFAYRTLHHGQILDFSYLWGGRSSCKRRFLRHAIHDRRFLNMQDVELGYKLAKFGLKVVYNRNAKSEMIREMTFDEFCRRSVRQGRAQYLFSQVHREPEAQRYCKLVHDARANLAAMLPELEAKTHRALALQRRVEGAPAAESPPELRAELHGLYAWIFKAWKLKGIVEEMDAQRNPVVPRTSPATAGA